MNRPDTDKKLKIVLTSPLAPDGKRGTYYSRMLRDELEKLGHKVVYMKFGLSLPTGLRHKWFFLRLLPYCLWADYLIAFDTFGVALPTAWAGVLTRTKTIVRVGGDYLWETHVNRTGEAVLYKDFYISREVKLNLQERAIRFFTRFIYKWVTAVVFSTRWQREIMRTSPYSILDHKVHYVENFIGERQFVNEKPKKKNYIWIGRSHKTKNLDRLKEAFKQAQEQVPDITLEIYSNIPQAEVLERMKSCYVYVAPAVSEFSPNLPLEALLYGKLVILTKESGYTDMLAPHTTLFDPTSTDELRDAIIKLADEREYDKALGRARKFTRTHSYRQIAQEFINIIQKI